MIYTSTSFLPPSLPPETGRDTSYKTREKQKKMTDLVALACLSLSPSPYRLWIASASALLLSVFQVKEIKAEEKNAKGIEEKKEDREPKWDSAAGCAAQLRYQSQYKIWKIRKNQE